MNTATAAFLVMYWIMLFCGLSFLAWLAFTAIRGMYRYYRDCKPRPMARRVTDKPRPDDRSSIQQFQRINRP